jgi:nitrite reductase (cytochrome c-552)
MPDLSTKEKAQQYIGIDMVELTKQKSKFRDEEIPKWNKQAEERVKNMLQ